MEKVLGMRFLTCFCTLVISLPTIINNKTLMSIIVKKEKEREALRK